MTRAGKIQIRLSAEAARIAAVSAVLLLFLVHDISSQVITNAGSFVSVSGGTFVTGRDLRVNSGNISNDGTLDLAGNLLNQGNIGGNGFYILKGNWTNNGSFNPGSSEVILNGLADQLITHASSGERFFILTINNPGIVTQVSNPGGSLTILSNFNLQAGTLNLDVTTSNLSIGGNAGIAGRVNFGNVTQVTSISGNLSGSGTIDMSAMNLPHTLYLGGATNAIGTFITSNSLSTVNYNGAGPTQTVFAAPNYMNLTISNAGKKILQGSSVVNKNLNVSGGTFDLGTTTATVNILGSTSLTGNIEFNGTSAKVVSMLGSLIGTGKVDMSGGDLAHILNLNGVTNSIGSYSSGLQSTVLYTLNGDQSMFASDDYRNLSITGGGLKTMLGDINTKGILAMSSGDIDAGNNLLYVSNPSAGAINRTNGTVIGKLKREASQSFLNTDYLYPVGSFTSYNPLNIKYKNLTSGGLTVHFRAEDPLWNGGPLDDDGNEVWDRYTTGYWSLSSQAPMATNDFDVRLDHEGFTGVDLSASIVRRNSGGNMELDGSHVELPGDEIAREVLNKGISTSTDLVIGRGRPRFYRQPVDADICDLADTSFTVRARGRGGVTYQWQFTTGTVWVPVVNSAIYDGADKSTLKITGAPHATMNGLVYRCVVTDAQGNSHISETALLTVNKIPEAVATPSAQNECPGVAFATIELTTANDVPYTTFSWVRDTPAGLFTTVPTSGQAVVSNPNMSVINGTFSNTLDVPITVTFRIVPTGPAKTFCIGNEITATVTINPVPKVNAFPSAWTQCDSITTNIRLSSPSIFTSGVIKFRYTVTTTGNVTGFSTPVTDLPNNHFITDKLINHTDTFQVVTYRVTPVSPTGCAEGQPIDVRVTVNPTPRATPVNSDPSICYNGFTRILLKSPTVMAPGWGNVIFDYRVSVSDPRVTGDMNQAFNLPQNHIIRFAYRNTSDTIQSVYYTITPKIENASTVCVKGPDYISEVKVHALPLQRIVVTKPLTCAGGAGLAALRAQTSKGAADYHLLWRGPIGYTRRDSIDIRNLVQGKYVVTVTDNLNCTNRDSISIVPVYARAFIVATTKAPLQEFNLSCRGASDGSIFVYVRGGLTPPYRFFLVKNDADTIQSGSFSGNLNLADPTTFREYTGLGQGKYTLRIRDVNDCTDLREVTLRPPDKFNISLGKSVYDGGYSVKCLNYSDGFAEATGVTGGNQWYKFSWTTIDGIITPPATGSRINSIPAGTYTVTVTDTLGCQADTSITLTEPSGMILSGSQVSHSADNSFNISCNGGNDGSIDITITGGSGNYTYLWTGPAGYTATSQDISGLRAGTYTCLVRDLNGCDLMPMPTFTLSEPAPLDYTYLRSSSADSGYQINCFGGTGSVDVTVTGGSIGNYIYNWSTADGSGIIQGQADQTALTAGTYTLEIRDLNGCRVTKQITMTQPPEFNIALNPVDINCSMPGLSNGSIDLVVTGGVAPYTYAWSNGAITQDISGLSQGTYQVTVTYNNTCQKTASATINLPPQITYSARFSNFHSYEVSCSGMSDGEIHVTALSGQAPYTFVWTGPGGFTSVSTSTSASDLLNLKAGDYNLRITDANQCFVTETFNLREPGQLGIDFTLSSSRAGGFNLNCAGDSTGTIIVNPVNSVSRVRYIWSDGFSGRSRNGLKAGDYSVVITDDNNCSASATVTLTEPDSIKTTLATTSPFCPDMSDGEISVAVTGGVPAGDYSYRWSDNSTGRGLSGIKAGLFSVRVEDMNGCFVKDSLYVEPRNEACLILSNIISPNGDLINDEWVIGMKELYPQMEVKIYNRWGEILWVSEKGYPKPWDGRSNGAYLPVDSYHYTIDLHNGKKPIIGNVTIVK